MTIYTDIAEQSQRITGNSNEDIFVIDGYSSDYRWSSSYDGSRMTVWTGRHSDYLRNVEAIQFKDMIVRPNGNGGFTRETLEITEGKTVTDRAGRSEYVSGTTATDTFIVDSDSRGYRWDASNDGSAILLWNGRERDYLRDVEQIRFNDLLVTFDGTRFITESLTSNDSSGSDSPESALLHWGFCHHSVK